MREFELRRAEWCAKTGLKISKARHTSVLSWLDKYHIPIGFDHTGIYYHPETKQHILITEPYHTVDRAISHLELLAHNVNKKFNYSYTEQYTGLWNPRACRALLVASDKFSHETLLDFARKLPKVNAQ